MRQSILDKASGYQLFVPSRHQVVRSSQWANRRPLQQAGLGLHHPASPWNKVTFWSRPRDAQHPFTAVLDPSVEIEDTFGMLTSKGIRMASWRKSQLRWLRDRVERLRALS